MSLGSRKLQVQAEVILRQYLKPIYSHLEDPSVQEVMVNAPNDIWIESKGKMTKLDLVMSDDAVTNAITVLANLNAKGTKHPILDCKLPGLRIAATLTPIALHGPSMCIRRHSAQIFTMQSYVDSGAFAPSITMPRRTLTDRPADADIAAGHEGLQRFLEWLASSRYNFILSGSTSAGKTALLNAMAAFIPTKDRVLTIEDTAELKMSVPNWIAFESNPDVGVTTRDLIKHALRYRSNRIWVGEVRGLEAFDVLHAYKTGHPGSGLSLHSEEAALTLGQLETMIRMAPEAASMSIEDLRTRIASTFKFVLHASNLDGHRGPEEVMEILGVKDGRYVTKSIFKKQIIYV